jgi:ATP-dependent helicase HrpB
MASLPRSNLPIEDLRADLLAALAAPEKPAILIKAPTGSGKSTQVPQMILDSGVLADDHRIVVLQPRRIAARMLAARVAAERGGKLGHQVGYQVRFENVTSAATRITFVTEGVLIRQLLQDGALAKVGCVVIDEFHERHLDGDLCLAWIRALQQHRRPDLRLVVMSATLVPTPLQTFLQPSRLLTSEGRTFPVEIRYQNPLRTTNALPEPVWDQAARACEALAKEPDFAGHILVFMPGAYEIQKTMQTLQSKPSLRGRLIVPMHGELTPDQQDAAVAPSERPKIIVSTNVAETSLTIEGVRAVIDSGLARIAAYDSRRGINTLTIQKISQASAEQRSGRAGRTGPGIGIRLWPEREHSHRAESERPEVHRLDLSEAVLALKQAATSTGSDELTIDWFETPPEASLQRAHELLHALGALDPQERLTALGRQMTQFPLHPRFARLLLAAAENGCLREAAICAAVAQGRDILVRPKPGAPKPKDTFWEPTDLSEFQALIRAFIHAEAVRFTPDSCIPYGIHVRACVEAARSRDQFLRLAQRAGLPLNDQVASPEALARTLLAAFSDHLGCETGRGSRVYELDGGYRGHLSKDAHLKPPPFIIAAEIIEIQGKALQVQLNLVTQVQEDWLRTLYPDDFQTGQRAVYDAVNRRVMNREEVRFRSLVLSSRERGEPDTSTAASLLADEVESGTLQLPNWNERVEQWITRVNCLAKWMPELEIPAIGPEDRRLILEQVCHGCTAYRQLKEREVFPALHQWLNPMQRDLLDRYAPERLPITKDRSAKIHYEADASPSISAVLQHLYDMKESPRIASGRIPLTVHLLSPAQRPIATTGDLTRFWLEGYPLVKKDLRGRYPKHEWR